VYVAAAALRSHSAVGLCSCRCGIAAILKKYSNFVSFPIMLNGSRANTVKALWTMRPSEVPAAEHAEFFRFINGGEEDPLFTIHFQAETKSIQCRALLYIPKASTERFGLSRMEPDISLYTQRVMIQAKTKGIVPEWLRFLSGVVESEDIPLNLSRELLQDRTLVSRLKDLVTSR
jgi:TNF receptor-associated protein 1